MAAWSSLHSTCAVAKFNTARSTGSFSDLYINTYGRLTTYGIRRFYYLVHIYWEIIVLTTQRFFHPEPPCSNTFKYPFLATTGLIRISSKSGTYNLIGRSGCVAGAGASHPFGASDLSGEQRLFFFKL